MFSSIQFKPQFAYNILTSVSHFMRMSRNRIYSRFLPSILAKCLQQIVNTSINHRRRIQFNICSLVDCKPDKLTGICMLKRYTPVTVKMTIYCIYSKKVAFAHISSYIQFPLVSRNWTKFNRTVIPCVIAVKNEKYPHVTFIIVPLIQVGQGSPIFTV